MAEIKPDEISAILRQQLGNFNAGAELEEVGTVLQVGDGIELIGQVLNPGKLYPRPGIRFMSGPETGVLKCGPARKYSRQGR